MNRIDKLAECRESGEGILSISLAPDCTREYKGLLDEVSFLIECGLNQLLVLYYQPQIMGVGLTSPSEVRAVKERAQKGTYPEAFFDSVAEIRKNFPDLAIIASGVVWDVACYGQKRFLEKCRKIGIDALDFPNYCAVKDPIEFCKDTIEADLRYIYSFMSAGTLDLTQKNQQDVVDRAIDISSREIFVVPGIAGEQKAIDGRECRPIVDYIKEYQKKNEKNGCVIGIGGINTAEDAYQLVHVIGMDGVHFSSAYLNRIARHVPRQDIAKWLKGVKNAMQKT